MNKPSKPFAAYLTELVEESGQTKEEIAEAAGFFSAAYLGHVLNGRAKIPIRSTASLAKALGRDPKHFLRMVLGEYSPDTLDAIQGVLALPLVSQNELDLLSVLRAKTDNKDLPFVVTEIEGGFNVLTTAEV